MKTTLFISDLHLDARRPAITDLFLAFLAGLDSAQVASLYILGDLFEAWIGDDSDDAHDLRVQTALRATTDRGIPIFVMHGNRDFLLGAAFATTTGCTLLADPTLIELNAVPTLLMHGDTLCTDDVEYQQFRNMVRNLAWQQQLLNKPITERRAIAATMRETSRQRAGEKSAEIMDVNAGAVEAMLREYQIPRLIHGHTHRPAIHDLMIDGTATQRIVLGDWYEQGSVLRCDEDGLHLESLPLAKDMHL